MTQQPFGPVRASKFMALLLRHNPAAGNLTLDAEGWTPVEDLLTALQRAGIALSLSDLKGIVAADTKGRYALSCDEQRIRANQGHSTKQVTLTFEQAEPPPVLYHGTVASVLDVILSEGLNRMQRHHVHLSGDIATARNVGARRAGRLVVIVADAARMRADGHTFFRSTNGVWLVNAVPPGYLSVI
jgi:putative RNA 2'-phosphotransferase